MGMSMNLISLMIFPEKQGIKRELVVLYNPRQNGVAKMKNKTICEASRAMFCDIDPHLSLWDKVSSTPIYI